VHETQDLPVQCLKGFNGSQPLFLFATHGAAADSDHARIGLEHATNLVSSAVILGTYSCQGKIKTEFLAKAKNREPRPLWVDDADRAIGHPDAEDIKRLKEAVMKAVRNL